MATAADGSSTTTQYVRDAQGNVLAVYAFKASSGGGLTEGDWLEQLRELPKDANGLPVIH